MKRVFWFILFVVLFGIVVGAQLLHFGSYDTSVLADPPSKQVRIAGELLTVYVADTPIEQEKGLSGRDSLPKDQGMLFVFPKDDTYSFWMKDMKFPIDIIWLDAGGTVVHIASNVSPSTYPSHFRSPVPARYVLEVNAGFVDQHQITVGNVLYNN